MLYKTTNKLFKGIYPYKAVVVSAVSSSFRGNDFDIIHSNLQKVTLTSPIKRPIMGFRSPPKTQEELDYALDLLKTIKNFSSIELRVESPYISIYTTDKKDIEKIIKLNKEKIKYICIPPENIVLDKNTIISPKRDFDYKITLGKTTSNHSAFITWAESSSNLKITKSCKSCLSKDRSWGGTHFYVKGEKNLLMAKMHLGGSIAKIEQILKQKP